MCVPNSLIVNHPEVLIDRDICLDFSVGPELEFKNKPEYSIDLSK